MVKSLWANNCPDEARKTPTRLVLYDKPGCHLCEIAYELVCGVVQAEECVIEKIDITQDPQLYARYRDKIPVLVVNSRITLFAPIRTAEVREALSEQPSC